ncbi:zinc-binding protein A33-like [Chiloscyllium plagiosum]|uniref:zinc-binding protein A33-like n=1 Tax=Chiloscyllium plagiosum TaxID=36176 RepID=UPI001CB88394|nr:zinc-binding protein A33-like [Chiloscyllium plagiosum]
MEKNLRDIRENLNSIEEKLSKLQQQLEQKDKLIFLKVNSVAKKGLNMLGLVTQTWIAEFGLAIGNFKGPLQYTAWREILNAIYPVPAALALDPNTANLRLILAEDCTSLRLGNKPQLLPDSPERFDPCPCVLGSEGFTTGRHYWEVEVWEKIEWSLGMARESVERKEGIDLDPKNGFWIMGLFPGIGYFAATSPSETLPFLSVKRRKIAVFLDYESGQVSFYNADTMSHLHTCTHIFTEWVFPFFHPRRNDGGKNSTPLTISGIKGH